jgi:hypothetical protein
MRLVPAAYLQSGKRPVGHGHFVYRAVEASVHRAGPCVLARDGPLIRGQAPGRVLHGSGQFAVDKKTDPVRACVPDSDQVNPGIRRNRPAGLDGVGGSGGNGENGEGIPGSRVAFERETDAAGRGPVGAEHHFPVAVVADAVGLHPRFEREGSCSETEVFVIGDQYIGGVFTAVESQARARKCRAPRPFPGRAVDDAVMAVSAGVGYGRAFALLHVPDRHLVLRPQSGECE